LSLSVFAAPPRALFLVPRLDKASTRYRVLQYLPALQQAGVDYEVRAVSKTARNWLELYRLVRNADVVFIQKKLFPTLEIALLRLLAKRLVYDFDDAVMFKDGPATARQHARQHRRFAATASRADLLIAGNEYLREQALGFQKPVTLIPTPLDMGRYTPKSMESVPGRNVVLGWIGSRGTLKYLADIAPALEVIGERHPGVSLKIVADDFFELQHMAVIKKHWSATDEIADLHSFDIGLMPLRDDVWTRGKCGFKLLQCMAVGLPVVCSPVGMNADIVRNGVEGFCAASLDEWVERLSCLIEEPERRRTMGESARSRVLVDYSLAANTPAFIQGLLGSEGLG